MKNIIICEGSTDGILLQYFMREVHCWEDGGKQQKLFGNKASWYRRLKKDKDILDIVSGRGSSTLLGCMEYLIDINKNANVEEVYNKVAIVTDRDEYSTETDFVTAMSNLLTAQKITTINSLKHNEWMKCEYESANGRKRQMELLLLIIPFEDNGAMETFLLNSISKKEPYDANIIQQGNTFVDTVDADKKYLKQRRYITKAKFDVYFSVRTPAAQFNQRQDIIRGVRWEDYIDLQGEFKKLDGLNK